MLSGVEVTYAVSVVTDKHLDTPRLYRSPSRPYSAVSRRSGASTTSSITITSSSRSTLAISWRPARSQHPAAGARNKHHLASPSLEPGPFSCREAWTYRNRPWTPGMETKQYFVPSTPRRFSHTDGLNSVGRRRYRYPAILIFSALGWGVSHKKKNTMAFAFRFPSL